MPVLSFDLSDVGRIFEHIMTKGHTPRPTAEDLFNPEYYPNGKVIEENGWPVESALDVSKLPLSFGLVKDKGVYLMAGVKEPLKGDKTENFVTYAKNYDPDKDNDWYEMARSNLGGDDFAFSIPADWYVHALSKNSRKFRIRLNKNSIALA